MGSSIDVLRAHAAVAIGYAAVAIGYAAEQKLRTTAEVAKYEALAMDQAQVLQA
jgi:hypothetical protein